MAIDVSTLSTRPLDPVIDEELVKFEEGVRQYLAGEIEEDVFRVFRLNQGIYGQRQGGHNQMVRVKVPHGSLVPEQLEMLGYLADEYSRGWAHLTTRQNVQMHFVQLEQTPELLRLLASVDLTSREACGDTVRNVTGCHLAGACPFEVLDISPWAKATTDFFLRNPYAQRLPRKFKINFSGCVTDCGQAMFNDVGVIGVNRPKPDGTLEPGFKVFVAGGLGANPHPAQALEEFTPREQLMPTLEAIVRVFDHYGNRDNKLRARMKWLVDTMGMDELRERIFKERKFLPAASSYPGGIPDAVQEQGDAPAGARSTSGGRTPTSCAAAPTAPSAPTRTPASATSPPTSSVSWRRSSASSGSRYASRTGRTSPSGACARTSSPTCTRGSPRSGWRSRAPSSPATSWRAPAPTRATSP
jgi:sulfite reductase beta subunit-like hemoprotein